MESNIEFVSLSDKPALLALSSPDWQEAARAALAELGYKVFQAATHSDFATSFTQTVWQVVVIEDRFAADSMQENESLAFVRSAPMNLRRHCLVLVAGDAFTSFDPMQAIQMGVHLVVNRTEMSLLMQFIQKVAAENEVFLKPYQDAQRRLSAGPSVR
jgi:hypothetical protein